MLAVSMSPPIAHYPAVQKKPKLSLKTSELPITYGTVSRNLLTIATPNAAVTPTTFNTFNNTYDLTHRPSPTSATASPSILRSASGYDRISRSQSPLPRKSEAAYTVNLPYGIKPILKNTPYPRDRTNSISASPRSNTRRVFFPAPKQVVFKNSIEEEVVTKVYTARHSDFFQQEFEKEASSTESDDVDRSDANNNNNNDNNDTSVSSEQSEDNSSSSVSESSLTKRLEPRIDLVTSDSPPPSSTDNESSTVATPVSTRKCRKWEWTLAPIPTPTQPIPSPKSDDEPSPTVQSASEKQSLALCSQASKPKSGSESALITPRSPRQGEGLSLHQAGPKLPVLTQPHPYPQLRLSRTTSSSTSQSVFTNLSSDLLSVNLTVPKQSYSAPPTPPLPSSPLLSPPQLHPNKRAGSLDGSPRKRKAECLDISTASSSIDVGDENPSGSVEDDDGAAGRTGTKRRGRAATL